MTYRAVLTAFFVVSCGSAEAAPVTVKPTNAARALHERVLTLDTHLDTPANFLRPGWNMADSHSMSTDPSQVDIPRMIKGGLDGGFFVIYTPQQARTVEGRRVARDHAFKTAFLIREMVARNASVIELAFTANDAARIAKSGKRIAYQSIENSDPIASDLSLLKVFYDTGVRMIGPVHFLNNDFGDSSTDPKGKEWNGLSPLGRQLVADANRLGMILDASHASDDVLDQMLELSKAPIILSHSGAKAVFDHPRNVDDARLKALAAKGGVIQINAYPDYVAPILSNPERTAAMRAMLGKYGPRDTWTPAIAAAFMKERTAIADQFPRNEPTFDDFMKHLTHTLALIGPNHVGVGADWDGGGGVAGLADVTDIPQITERLKAAGYADADIEKIWSGNVLRVLRAVEAEATRQSAVPKS